jgi:hypothetical protein
MIDGTAASAECRRVELGRQLCELVGEPGVEVFGVLADELDHLAIAVGGLPRVAAASPLCDSICCAERRDPPIKPVVQAHFDHIKALSDIGLYWENKTGRNVIR